MRVCGICGNNELLEEDELNTGVCRYCMSSLLIDDDKDNIAS